MSILGLSNLQLDKTEFLLGKNSVLIDKLSMIIKYYIYFLRINEKTFSKDQFLREIQFRWLADRESKSQDRLHMKLAIIPIHILENRQGLLQ